MISPGDSSQVKVVKGAAIILAGLAFARLVNYAYQILLSRAGGEAEFGLFFLGISSLTLAGGVAALGIDLGVARFAPLYIGSGERNKLKGTLLAAIAVAIVSGTAIGIALWSCAGRVAQGVFSKPELAPLLEISAFCLPFYVSGRVLVKAIVAFQKIGYRVSVSQVASPLVRLVGTFMLVTAGLGAKGAMWAYAASELISCLSLLAILQWRVFPLFEPGGARPEFNFRPFLAYSLPLFLAAIVDQVLNSTDAFMTGYFLPSGEVGVYGAAARLASFIGLGTELLNPLFLSIVTQAQALGNNQEITRTFNSNNRWFLFISLPVFSLLAVLSGRMMSLVWGPGFAAGGTSLALLAAGRMLFCLATTSTFLLSMYGASRLIFAISLTASLLNVVLNYFLIPLYGIAGAALATAVSLSVSALLSVQAAGRYHGQRGLVVFNPRVVVSAALPATIVFLLTNVIGSSILAIIALAIVFAVLYLIFLRAFGAFAEEDREIWAKFKLRLGLAQNPADRS
ncbi:MAG TPA: flippase [Candidatus Glassbacteria bacterium]|nr:flippase [Candidatus Glassbacteria bacterium]